MNWLANIKNKLFSNNTNGATSIYDPIIIYCIVLLIGVGFVMVTSASMAVAERLFNNPFHFTLRHGIFLGLSFIVLGVSTNLPMAWWKKANPYLLGLGFILLIIVLVIGREVNGSTRWIGIGPFNIQVAEIAKLFFFSYLAGYLVRKRNEVKENFKGFIKPIAVFVVYAGLILMQPDLGTVVVMFVTTVGLLFLAGAQLWQFFMLLMAGGGLIGVLIVFSPYRWARVTSFWDPWDDPFGKGYQLVQSLMAYGRGSWWGQGLGNSIQKQEYLPEAHTDFIFSVIAEETGFIGVLSILCVLCVLVFRALLIGKKALKSGKEYEGYFALAIGIWFAFQTMVNIGASAGILPTKGLTLPFISYGGSSMLMMTIAIGILIRIDFEVKMATRQATSGGRKKQ